MSQLSIAQYAKIYTERYNWHLVPIEAGRKYPTKNDWGNTALSEPAQAYAYWQLHQDWNMGCALGHSAMCSLDIDDEQGWLLILDEFGIPHDALDAFPTIRGRGKRVMFRVPDDVQLPYCKVNWPKQDDQKKHYTIIELRAACDGSQKQDVLPPSVHPETNKPYAWEVKPPKTLAEWPAPPDWLLAIWTAWDSFKPQLQGVCPWLPKPEPKQYKPSAPAPTNGMPDVQSAYNAAYPIENTLEIYGYKRKGKRYLSPHSGTGLAGVHLLDDNKCWIHHASDPLCSEDSGKPVSSYDLYCYYECGGDYSKAFKQAAATLGIQLRQPTQVKPSASYQQQEQEPELPVEYDPEPDAPLPYCTEKGAPLAHIANLKEICRRLGVVVRYNVISKDEELLIPNQSFSLDNGANASLAWLESECSLFKMPTTKLQGFITYLADRNQYNPVATWVNSKPWDGKDRLHALLATVKAKNEATDQRVARLKETLIVRWLISAVAAAFSPDGVSAAGVLVFQGEQYVGKTKWFKSLAPTELNVIKDGVILKPDDRDSVKQACSFWLVELGELDSTFRKSDIAALKAFITAKQDVIRRAYARKESQYARRTVFFASVNPKGFLNDPTGNRRYWTIEVEELDHSHGIDMQQMWAQVYEQLYKEGESWYLTVDELNDLNAHNEDFTAAEPIDELIQQLYDWGSPDATWRYITATDVVKECGYERPTKHDSNSAAAAIRKLNGNRGKRTGTAKLLLVPPVLHFK